MTYRKDGFDRAPEIVIAFQSARHGPGAEAAALTIKSSRCRAATGTATVGAPRRCLTKLGFSACPGLVRQGLHRQNAQLGRVEKRGTGPQVSRSSGDDLT